MRILSGTLLAALALSALTACGSSDDSGGSSAAPGESATTAASSPSPSASPSQDTQLIGINAQGVGLAVAAWSVKNDFALPTDQADFEAKIKYASGPDAVDLAPGSKVGYRKTGPKKYETCVVEYDGGTPTGWGTFDSVSGRASDGSGTPTSKTCPS